MEDLWMVFCGESGKDIGEKLSSSSSGSGSGLVFQPTSCINHALIICFNVLLLIMLLLTSIQKSSSPSKIDDILPRFRGYSRIQIVSAIFNGCIGFVYLCSGIWILEEKMRKNQTALPLKSWLVVLFQGFAWLLVGLTISLRGKHLQRTLLRLLSILAFLLAGIVCAFSIYSVILGQVISIKMALDVLTFPGAILLLLCAYKVYKHEGSYGSDLYAPLNGEANGTTKTDSAVKVTLFAEAGFFNKMSFWWLNPLMRKGKEKTLEDEDIPKLREEDRAESCYIEFLEQLNKHKQSESSQLSLLWIIIFCHWKDILISGFFALLKILTLSAGPLLLNAFILVAEGKAGFKYEGYVLALTLFFSKNLESLSQRQWYFRSRLIGLKVKSLLTAAIYKKQLRLSSLGRLMHSGGEIMNYVTVDAYRIGEFPFWFHQTWTTSLQLCISLVILYRAMGLATFAALMVIIITVLCNAPLAKLQHKFQSKLMVAQDERLKACNEALVNMKVLKLYAWETHFKNAIENLREVEYKWLSSVQMRRAYNGFLFWSSPVLVSSATFGACYFMKIPLHANNVFTFVATLRLVQDPIRSIPDVIGVVIQAKVAFARIVKFLEAPELQSRNVQQRHNTGSVSHSVLIKSADFSWEENSSRPTLRNVSLKMVPGEKVAVCGEVGSGKSTLLAAILGEVSHTKGTIQVHGRIAYVSQTAWIQTGTIQENILFGSEMDRQRYQDTLERCSLVKDLELLPYGDLTEIGERGVNLSGGQKQRIQLARALYQNADIYLLDDPFSAVDAQTATSLFNEYITGALSGKTVLLVTHQVDFLPAFDSVMLMSNGEILQADPYHQLLSSSQEFQDLVNAHKETAGSERLPEANAMQRQGSSAGEIEKSHVEKQHKTSQGDQLIKQEEKEVGDTGFKPYIEYLNQNKGYLYFALACFGHLLFVTGQILQNSWMAANVDDPHVSPLRLIVVYLSIGVTSVLFVLCRSIFTVVLGLESSKTLFSQLLNSLFRAPMSFYDSTPLGRILSRVASDLSIVDLDVPFSLIFAVGATTNAYSNMGVLAFVTWQVLFVSIPMVYLAIRLQRYYFASAKELMRINGTTKSLVANHLAESVAGALTIRAFEGEDRFFEKNLHLIDINASPFFHSFAANEWLIQRLETFSATVLASAALCVVLLPPGTFSSDAYKADGHGRTIMQKINLSSLTLLLALIPNSLVYKYTSIGIRAMDTRAKTNTEFRNEVSETLARHESGINQTNLSIEQVNATLQTVVAELQALRHISSQNFTTPEFTGNLNCQAEASNTQNSAPSDLNPPNHPISRNLTHLDNPHYHQNLDRNYSTLKLSFPRFNGVDPTGWLYKAEQYFEFQNIHPQQKVHLASFHLEEDALQWHRWLNKFRGHLTWTEFTQAVLHRFGPTDYEDPSEALTRLKQTTTVNIYQTEFEQLSQRIDGLPENYLVGCFVAGLRDDIRLDVKVKQPRTLMDAIGVARLVEERIHLLKKISPAPRAPGLFSQQKSPGTTLGLLGPPPLNNQNSSPQGGFKRITSQEARDRRAKGLCFYCDEKFTRGHRCQRPQLFMIEDTRVEGDSPDEEDEEDFLGQDPIMEISFHAISGTNHPQTIRVIGKINHQSITVLIDGGSTHNFLEQSVVSRLGLPVLRDKKFHVMVANREKIECSGRCLGLRLIIDGYIIQADFYILPVAACQAVLGVQWLATLGPIETDYQKLTMSFRQNGITRIFKGLRQTPHKALRDKELANLEGWGFFLQIAPVEIQENSTVHSQDLSRLLDEFQLIFTEPTGLPPKRTQDHNIPLLPNHPPISVRPYRYPHYQKSEIEKMVKEFLDSGLIRPSCSPFSSPVLLVKKADGSWRFCIDYRALNHITVKDKYPIPVIDELLDELFGAKYFSKLDLRSGYHQIRVKEEDIPKTAFRTHDGHYEFIVMPFGLTNAPATFQGLMNDLFRPHLRKFVLVFFDDILVYSHTWGDHLFHLHTVLTILATNQLFVKQSKCRFGVLQVDYLGHIISHEGVQVDPAKTRAVNDWPTPTTTKGVRGFLGLAGYYRKFISGFGGIAGPLTQLLTKDGFHWTPEAASAFQQLKHALVSPPVLRLPDFTQTFIVESDACGVGIGAILIQEEKPIAFYSEALKGSSLTLSTYEKEMLAIVKAIRKWHAYLLGKPFIVRTDQRSLKFLMEQRITTPTQARWLPKIMGYDYIIQYKKGKENQGADALSRVAEWSCSAISLPIADWWTVLQQEVTHDPFYSQLDNQSSQLSPQVYFKRDGVWYYKGRVYLSPSSSLIPAILSEHHASPTGGHFGYHKSLSRLQQSFNWPGLRTAVKDYIKECEVCQRCKTDNTKPGGLLQPLPIPLQIWTDISMDFVEGLPVSQGFTVIMVVVDRLSKYTHFVPLKHPFTASSVAKHFMDNIVRLHGLPRSIVSDRDKIFVSSFWKTLFQLQGTTLAMSSSYHPQTDGQTEVVNRTLEQYLRCFTSEQPKKWAEWLSWAEYSYNTSVHSATKVSPFEAVYGIPPPSLLSYVPGTTKVQAVDDLLRSRTEVLQDLRRNLLVARDRMKSQADQHRKEVNFTIGDYVYLKLHPYRQNSVNFRRSLKLSPRYFGPYRVVAKIGPVAYRLELPVGSLIHDVFHVSLLKKHVGSMNPVSTVLPPVSEASTIIPQPEVILNTRVIQKDRYRPKTEILVKWKGAPVEDATWENKWRFSRSYPEFILEDKNFSGREE